MSNKRVVVFPRLQKKVEYVALCHPNKFEKMTNAQIRYDVWRTFHSHVDSWCEYPLTLNSISKAKMAVKDKIFTQKENAVKAQHHDRIPKFVRLLCK